MDNLIKYAEDASSDGYQFEVTGKDLTTVLEALHLLAKKKAAHPDDIAVESFATAMREKLAKKRSEGRGGWEDPQQCSADELALYLVNHVTKGDPVDVANLAMMLFHRQGGESLRAIAITYMRTAADGYGSPASGEADGR